MDYIVIEIQTQTTGQVATLVNAFSDKNTAEQKYHQILSAAAVSNVAIHSASMLTSDGRQVKYESYTHIQNAEPEE